MTFRNLTIAVVLLCACASVNLSQTTKPAPAPAPAQDSAAKEKAAQSVAAAWLALVDTENVGESWEQAGAAFKQAIAKDDWGNAVKQVRQPLGKLKKRDVKFSQYKDKLDGAPTGEYVLIQYDSAFTAVEKASELVTLTLEKDGKWRIVGYFVR